MSSKLDLEQLVKELRHLRRWQPLYKILKRELKVQGFWKEHPRGDASKGYRMGWGKNKHHA